MKTKYLLFTIAFFILNLSPIFSQPKDNLQENYNGFDLWNEFRVGYQFNFEIRDFPCLSMLP
ncbi:MAG: hypothetical protein PF447_07630, partial [Spirochaetaceae bacterium]|nr:hypothetical protein [Spirochaetaceae bacterium]